MKTKNVFKLTPGMPQDATIPHHLIEGLGNLSAYDIYTELTANIKSNGIDWRHMYNDPLILLIIMCEDSGASQEMRLACADYLKEFTAQLRSRYLPMMDANGARINDVWDDERHNWENLDRWREHNPLSYLHAYAELVDNTVKQMVTDYSRWMLWDAAENRKGSYPLDTGEFYYRVFLRELFAQIYMSESHLLSNEVKQAHATNGIKAIRWMLSKHAGAAGQLNELGWSDAHAVMYFDWDASNDANVKERVVHCYFHGILQENLIRIKVTDFYNQHQHEVDQLVQWCIQTVNSIIHNSAGEFNCTTGAVETATLYNMNREEFCLDKTENGKHCVFSKDGNNGIGYPP
ncbi:MAG TPA: hypothetical protein ENJ32_05365, partial [Crenotrichaceae bacterium]|nr:hypothetical protein [Crenotrichaceae bacterium]